MPASVRIGTNRCGPQERKSFLPFGLECHSFADLNQSVRLVSYSLNCPWYVRGWSSLPEYGVGGEIWTGSHPIKVLPFAMCGGLFTRKAAEVLHPWVYEQPLRHWGISAPHSSAPSGASSDLRATSFPANIQELSFTALFYASPLKKAR